MMEVIGYAIGTLIGGFVLLVFIYLVGRMWYEGRLKSYNDYMERKRQYQIQESKEISKEHKEKQDG